MCIKESNCFENRVDNYFIDNYDFDRFERELDTEWKLFWKEGFSIYQKPWQSDQDSYDEDYIDNDLLNGRKRRISDVQYKISKDDTVTLNFFKLHFINKFQLKNMEDVKKFLELPLDEDDNRKKRRIFGIRKKEYYIDCVDWGKANNIWESNFCHECFEEFMGFNRQCFGSYNSPLSFCYICWDESKIFKDEYSITFRRHKKCQEQYEKEKIKSDELQLMYDKVLKFYDISRSSALEKLPYLIKSFWKDNGMMLFT